MEPYNGNANDPKDPDPKRQMSADTFIGLLREEYKIRGNRINNANRNTANASTNLVSNQKTAAPSKSLKARIEGTKFKQAPYCDHCKLAGNWTSRCCKDSANKCYNCRKTGHRVKDCWSKKRDKDKDKDKDDDKGKGKAKDQMNMVEEELTFRQINLIVSPVLRQNNMWSWSPRRQTDRPSLVSSCTSISGENTQ